MIKKKIAVMTSGGDAPGMNAAIRGVYCKGKEAGYDILGIHNGFQGLLDGDISELHYPEVANIMRLGGTILGTARCEAFHKREVQERAAKRCRELGVNAVVIIGGDGSFRGGEKLFMQGIPVIGIPGTIDLDIACTEYTIGFDTAVNSAMEAIDKIEDTSQAHSCCSVIEVMGRHAGYIAMWCGIADTAQTILIPEKYDYNEDLLFQQIQKQVDNGIKYTTVIVAEGVGKADEVAEKIEQRLGIHTRSNTLGFLQRGGNPTCKDRLYGFMMGAYAVELLQRGKQHHVVAIQHDSLQAVDIMNLSESKKEFPENIYHLSQILNPVYS